MNLNIMLTEEEEWALREIAQRERLSPEQFATRLLRRKIDDGARKLLAPTRRDTPPKSTSVKVAGIRQAWRQHLKTIVNITDDEAKPLMDCTAEDCRRAEKARREKADVLHDAADRWEEWADLLDEYGVTTMGELPPEVLARILGGAR